MEEKRYEVCATIRFPVCAFSEREAHINAWYWLEDIMRDINSVDNIQVFLVEGEE